MPPEFTGAVRVGEADQPIQRSTRADSDHLAVDPGVSTLSLLATSRRSDSDPLEPTRRVRSARESFIKGSEKKRFAAIASGIRHRLRHEGNVPGPLCRAPWCVEHTGRAESKEAGGGRRAEVSSQTPHPLLVAARFDVR